LLALGIFTFDDNLKYFEHLKEMKIVEKIKLIILYIEEMKSVFPKSVVNIEYSLKALSNLIHSNHIIFEGGDYDIIYHYAKKYLQYEISRKIILKYEKK
jgi:hypothetical protein